MILVSQLPRRVTLSYIYIAETQIKIKKYGYISNET